MTSWARDYETRPDRFRRAQGIEPAAWAKKAGTSRLQLLRFRSSTAAATHTNTLAKWVKAAAEITKRPVRASEIVNIGEDDAPPQGVRWAREFDNPKRYGENTQLAMFLSRIGLTIGTLAKEARMPSQSVGKLVDGTYAHPRTDTVAPIVSTLRRLTGIAVRAQWFWNVGEESEPTMTFSPHVVRPE